MPLPLYILAIAADTNLPLTHPSAYPSPLPLSLEAWSSVCIVLLFINVSPSAGYPFDLPPAGSGLPTYCALVYHLPLLIGFSICSRTAFVWGGCVCMRAEGLRSDSLGILKVSKRGGGDV